MSTGSTEDQAASVLSDTVTDFSHATSVATAQHLSG